MSAWPQPSYRKTFLPSGFFVVIVLAWLSLCAMDVRAQQPAAPLTPAAGTPEKVIFDTDIGDDVDDAFAVALALQSPEVQILGIGTAWGDTPRRARLLRRMLRESGHSGIPVNTGVQKTLNSSQGKFTQGAYADAEPEQKFGDAVDFLLDQIRSQPGQITLIAIGPLSNVGAAIDRDPATFRKLKRVVMMGGSVYRGYDGFAYPTGPGKPQPEWNIVCDISSAQKLFASGVPLYVMPLDSTQIKLQELERARIFGVGTGLTDALTLLYHQWSTGTNQITPTLFDVVAAAYAIRPELCPTKSMRLRVDEQGFTRVEDGTPNANVCLRSDSDQFFEFYMPRVLAATPSGR